jgi:hypothetical protein
MVKVRVRNWRCIEDLELELAKVNVIVGPNSTGKSSFVYAIYFASKSRNRDPQSLLLQLYGYGPDKVARLVDGKPQFPISIKIDNSELLIELIEGKPSVTKIPQASPWAGEFLFPSRRISYFQVARLLPRITSEMLKGVERAGLRGFTFIGELFESLKDLPLLPPFSLFVEDQLSALTGIKPQSIAGEMKNVGSYTITAHILLPLIGITFKDPYTELQLPPELAPDGSLDFMISDPIMKMVPEGSLIVIEEPEIHKNPKMVKDFAELVVRHVLERELTLIGTTHSDIFLLTLGKLVEKGILKPRDVKVYYFTREKDRSPWTKASEIKVYENGTIEGWPDIDEVVVHLF